MFKKVLAVLMVCALLTLCSCGEKTDAPEIVPEGETIVEEGETAAPETEEAVEEQPEAAETSMPNGYRYEATITLEGMEETVNYEHVVSEETGIEIDYDYESFTHEAFRRDGIIGEYFVSAYEADADIPSNYMMVYSFHMSADEAKDWAAGLLEGFANTEELSENVGAYTGISCFHASDVAKGTISDIYIIPCDGGCKAIELRYTFESAEGFGARMRQMIDTIKIIEG